MAIIRATTADERGNLSFEHEGAFLGALDQALAARNNGGLVIAQVKRVVRAGSISPQHVHVPGTLVDHIVIDHQDSNHVYVSAWSVSSQQIGEIFRTRDGGKNWEYISSANSP